MSTLRITAILFAVVALVQLAIPASLIMRYERTLHDGKSFKFRAAPVDPADAFRGRYVALAYDNASVPGEGLEKIEYGSEVYALVETSTDGFAHFTKAMLNKPTGGDFIKAKMLYSSGEKEVTITPTFDRYYMEETIAPKAEEDYRQHSPRNGKRDAYVVVRVLDGTPVIEQVYLGDKTLVDSVKEASK